MAKYKVVFEEMIRQNKHLFDEFKEIHDQFAAQPNKFGLIKFSPPLDLLLQLCAKLNK